MAIPSHDTAVDQASYSSVISQVTGTAYSRVTWVSSDLVPASMTSVTSHCCLVPCKRTVTQEYNIIGHIAMSSHKVAADTAGHACGNAYIFRLLEYECDLCQDQRRRKRARWIKYIFLLRHCRTRFRQHTLIVWTRANIRQY